MGLDNMFLNALRTRGIDTAFLASSNKEDIIMRRRLEPRGRWHVRHYFFIY